MANGTIDYDIDAVLKEIKNSPQKVNNLVYDLNKLTSKLEECESSFHCKGGSSSNALMKIYEGFSKAVGQSNGNQSGKALGGCAALSAQILNVIYQEVKTDEKLQDSSNYEL